MDGMDIWGFKGIVFTKYFGKNYHIAISYIARTEDASRRKIVCQLWLGLNMKYHGVKFNAYTAQL